jgi:hypothetical protein
MKFFLRASVLMLILSGKISFGMLLQKNPAVVSKKKIVCSDANDQLLPNLSRCLLLFQAFSKHQDHIQDLCPFNIQCKVFNLLDSSDKYSFSSVSKKLSLFSQVNENNIPCFLLDSSFNCCPEDMYKIIIAARRKGMNAIYTNPFFKDGVQDVIYKSLQSRIQEIEQNVQNRLNVFDIIKNEKILDTYALLVEKYFVGDFANLIYQIITESEHMNPETSRKIIEAKKKSKNENHQTQILQRAQRKLEIIKLAGGFVGMMTIWAGSTGLLASCFYIQGLWDPFSQ